MGKRSEPVEIKDLERWIRDCLSEEKPCSIIETGENLLIAHRRIDYTSLYSHPLHRDKKEIGSTSIEISHHYEVITRRSYVEYRYKGSGLT